MPTEIRLFVGIQRMLFMCFSCLFRFNRNKNDHQNHTNTASILSSLISSSWTFTVAHSNNKRLNKNSIYLDFFCFSKRFATLFCLFYCRFEVDIVKESRRLLEGFSAAVCNSGKYIHKTIQELRKIVDVPAWQKSVFWTVNNILRNGK